MANNFFDQYIENFYSKLITEDRDRLNLFSSLQIQIEGWFRGELLHFIDSYRNEPRIKELTTESREVAVKHKSRRKVDLRIEINNELYWIELKHILIGKQKGNGFGLNDYFSKGTYIDNDIQKLNCLKANSAKTQHKFCLVFLSTNGWDNGNILQESNGKTQADTLGENINKNLSKYKARNQIKSVPDYCAFKYSEDCNFGYFLFEV